MEGTIGEIRLWASNFAPMYWAFCDGRLLSIRQFTPLFALVGTTYGGDGVNTFALPDLRGRTPIGAGQNPVGGLQSLAMGTAGGTEAVTLVTAEMPVHTHSVRAAGEAGTTVSPASAYPAGANGQDLYGEVPASAMGNAATVPAGGGQAHNNMMPYIGLNHIICLNGMFPCRD
jgi:microcystin-dependent protein